MTNRHVKVTRLVLIHIHTYLVIIESTVGIIILSHHNYYTSPPLSTQKQLQVYLTYLPNLFDLSDWNMPSLDNNY